MNRFEDFTSAMLLLNRYVQKAKEKEMAHFNLHATHTMVLYQLHQHDIGLTNAQLVNLCHEDKAAISRSIKQLIELGYAYIDNPSEKKNYRNLIHLTKEGIQVAETMNQRIELLLKDLSDGISNDQRDQLYKTLSIIIKNFQCYLDDK